MPVLSDDPQSVPVMGKERNEESRCRSCHGMSHAVNLPVAPNKSHFAPSTSSLSMTR